ncbi:MAG: hypothetical protein IT373_29665 [Polyangiaceae bacterium]|nr:hypothetical protein [Polyangiaceae bacterium]
MSTTLALQTRPLALEIHRLLADLDPARWRRGLETKLRTRSERIADNLASLLGDGTAEATPTPAEAPTETLVERLHHMGELLRARLPSPSLAYDEARAAWRSYREELSRGYESLAQALRGSAVVVPGVRPENRARSLFHILSAFSSLILFEVILGPYYARFAALAFAGTFWCLEGLRRVVPSSNDFLMGLFKHIAHPQERYRVNSSTWYGTALAILCFTQEPATTAAAVAILGLADPAAAFIGRRFGRIRLLHGRSLEGSLTFVAVGFVAAFAWLRLFHAAELTLPLALAAATGAALVAGVAEHVSRRVDDNFAIPLAGAAGMWLALRICGA